MGTAITLASHHDTDAGPCWRLYEEAFEAGVVYLELSSINIELRTLPAGGVDVVSRLPIATAEQLGLASRVLPDSWARASEGDKSYKRKPTRDT